LAYLDVVVAAGGHDLRCLRLEPDDRRLTRGQRLSMSCAVNPAGSFAGSPWNGSVLLSTATGIGRSEGAARTVPGDAVG